MSTLASLWNVSLLLCAIVLLAIAALLLARLVSKNAAARRDALRRILAPAMLRGDVAAIESTRQSRRVAANLTLELAELVRGIDRDNLIAVARAAGAPAELRRWLRSRASKKRLLAAEALAMFPEFAPEVRAVALADRNPDVRLGAVLALAQEGRAPPVGQIIRQLGMGSTEHSLLLVPLLRDLARADPQPVEALLYDLELPDVVKLAATEALAESGGVDHGPLVTWMAEAAGEDGELQPQILRALGQIGHPVGHDAIATGLTSTDWRVRAAAAQAAGRARLGEAAERLAQMLGDSEWWVRFRAGEALSQLGADGIALLRYAGQAPSAVARAAADVTLGERKLR